MEKLMDLHMHSYYSDDGEFSPEELVRQCAMSGIRVMSIADHNSVRANEAGSQAARRAGIRYVPGIEIDCTFEGVNLHVLGYGIDYKSDDFAYIEENIGNQAAAASRHMLQATRKMGFDVTEEDMAELARDYYWKDRWTGEMFAEVLLGKEEYRNHALLLPYREGGERGDNPFVNFYWDFYSQGKCCYVKIDYPELEQVVDIIHRNGGYAVLAHPGVNLRNHAELLDPILETGLDGIEAFSSYHSEEQAAFYHKAACDRRKMFTCGSDYHGKTKPSISIGGHGCTVPYEEMVRQLERILGENG